MVERPQCKTCPLWSGSADAWTGECRVDAPRLVGPPGDTAIFPRTSYDGWCGRHPESDAYIKSLRKAKQ